MKYTIKGDLIHIEGANNPKIEIKVLYPRTDTFSIVDLVEWLKIRLKGVKPGKWVSISVNKYTIAGNLLNTPSPTIGESLVTLELWLYIIICSYSLYEEIILEISVSD